MGFFLPPESMTVENSLPMYLDIVVALTLIWHKPLSTKDLVPVYGQFLELNAAEETSLANIPPMELSLASYLAMPHNHGVCGSATKLPVAG